MVKKIWLLIDSKDTGGIETHVLHLSRSLKQAGVHNQIVKLRNFGEHPVFDDPSNKDLRVIGFKSLQHLYQYYKKFRPVTIHAHGTMACLFAKLLNLRHRQHIVCTYHSGEKLNGMYRIYETLNKWTAGIGQSIAVSQPIADELKGKYIRIDNFIPFYQRKISVNQHKQIAFVGRLSHEKGPDRFLTLAKKFPDEKFVIYGKGSLFSKLNAEKSSNLSIRTDIKNMDTHWRNIKLLCITSREEGLPLVALEAMAQGVCVVSYPVGGLPELINNANNGFLLKDSKLLTMEMFIKSFLLMPDKFLGKISEKAQMTIQAHYSSSAVLPKIISQYTTNYPKLS